MSNDQMKANRFLKFARCRQIVAKIVAHLQAGGTVYIGTQTRATKFTKKHASMFKATKNGAFYQSGKKWLCFDDGLAYRMVGIAIA